MADLWNSVMLLWTTTDLRAVTRFDAIASSASAHSQEARFTMSFNAVS